MALVHGFRMPSQPETWDELAQMATDQDPNSKQGLSPLTTAETLNLYRNALRVSNPNCYHFPNLCGVDVDSDRAATIRGAGANDYQLRFCKYLTLRNSLFGNSILPAEVQEVHREVRQNLRERGFYRELPPSSNVFVDNIFCYSSVLQQLAAIGKRENRGIEVFPYQQSSCFADMVSSHGLRLVGPSREGLQIIDWARNKTEFRNFARQYPGQNLVPYPRIAFSRSLGESADSLICQLRRAIAFSLLYLARPERSDNINRNDLSEGFKALFVQLVEGAGGLGNFVVHGHFESNSDWLGKRDLLLEGGKISEIDSLQFEVHTPEGETISLSGMGALVSWLYEKAQQSDLEIAPFLEILYSFSVAAVVGETEFAFVGRMQQLNHLNAYEGYVWPEAAARQKCFSVHYQNALEFQKYFSAWLRWKGFFIPGGGFLSQGVDFAVIRMPGTGKEALIAVECNCRPQAPQPTEVLALSLTPWKSLLEKGGLVLLGMDHLNCPSNVDSPTELRRFLQAREFPLSSYHVPFGLLIISVQAGQCIGLFGAPSEEEAVTMLHDYRKVVS